jgi:beta-mannosidase
MALICGNNEIEGMKAAWTGRNKLLNEYRDFTYGDCANLIKKITTVQFTPSSPVGSEYMKGTASDNVGDTHIWNVWHGMMPFSYFFKRNTRFCSEFGFESLPPVETVRDIAESEADLDIYSPLMLAHQKCAVGNARILYYIIDKYRIPKSFSHLTYLSQLTQAECIQAATEHWRRKTGRCNGSLYWQINDCWHTASWSSIDYLGYYKALHYSAREFFKSVTVTEHQVGNAIRITGINDSLAPFNGTLTQRVVGFDGKEYLKKEVAVTLAAYSVDTIATVRIDGEEYSPKWVSVIAELRDENGVLVSRREHLPVKENEASLPQAFITKSYKITETGAEITLKSNAYARRVFLTLPGVTEPFSKNLFDIEANGSETITLERENLTAEIIEKLEIISYSDIQPKYPRYIEKAKKLKIALIPINFINRIIYRFM